MNIAARRRKLKMTQDDLAKQLNVDRTTVTKWETGKAAPRSFMLIRLAKILQCPVEELFDVENDAQTEVRDGNV